MLKKGDIVLFSFIILVILTGILYSNYYKNKDASAHKIAVIKQDDKVIRSIDLDAVQKPEIINIQGNYKLVIAIEMGRIRFQEANCPDRTCVKTGWLESKGDTAVCLPNRTIIKIERKAEKVDVISLTNLCITYSITFAWNAALTRRELY